eukprot:gene1079-1169_t
MEPKSAAKEAYDRIQQLLNEQDSPEERNWAGLRYEGQADNSMQTPLRSTALTVVSSPAPPTPSTSLVVKERGGVSGESIFLQSFSQEEAFYESMLEYFEHLHFSADKDLTSFASQMEKYGQICQVKYDDVQNISRRLTVGLVSDAEAKQITPTTSLELRVERDLWSLLKLMSFNDVLGIMEDSMEQSRLQSALANLPIVATVPDFVNTAYASDDSMKKSAVLKAWLESAALDKVQELANTVHEPWSDTLHFMKTATSAARGAAKLSITSLHPDGQLLLDKSGVKVLPLVGLDRSDQENLYLYIFQLIRSGQLIKAQQVANDHRMFWLAASLLGVFEHSYEDDNGGVDDGAMDEEQKSSRTPYVRRGNARQPVFTRSCWRYAEKLSEHPDNWVTGSGSAGSDLWSSKAYSRVDALKNDRLVQGINKRSATGSQTSQGMTEVAIYGSLSNHVKVLKTSPLLREWHDQLWVYIKAIHDRQRLRVLHAYRTAKAQRSAYYTGCDEEVIRAEEEVLLWLDQVLGPMGVTDCEMLLSAVPPPSGRNLVSIIYQLQAAVIRGKTGLRSFFEQTIKPLVTNEEEIRGEKRTLYRILSHVALWLRHCPKGVQSALQDGIISDELFYLILQRYIECLTQDHLYHLVAFYCVYLPRGQRIRLYANMLHHLEKSFSQSGGNLDNEEAAKAMDLAQKFFPEDVLDITRSVMEGVAFTSSSEAKQSASLSNSALKSGPTTVAALTGGADKILIASVPALQISSRPLDPVNLQISDQQRQQFESLRWFIMHSEHFGEAIKQINRAIVQAITLIPSQSTQSSSASVHPIIENARLLKLIVEEFVPSDLIQGGYDYLTKQEKTLKEDLQSRLYERHVLSSSLPANRQISLPDWEEDEKKQLEVMTTRKESWESDVAKLCFWKRLLKTVKTYTEFQSACSAYCLQKARLFGSPEIAEQSLQKAHNDLSDLAEQLVHLIRELLTTSPLIDVIASQEYASKMDGYRALWVASRLSGEKMAIISLESVSKILNAPKGGASGSGRDGLVQEITSVSKELAQQIAKTNATTSLESVFKTVQQKLSSHLSQVVENGELVSILSHLKQSLHGLKDVESEGDLSGTMLFFLLNTIAQTCLVMGAIFENLDSETGYKQAYAWYHKVVHLTNLIASDVSTLKLYSLIARDDLEKVMKMVYLASVKKLEMERGPRAIRWF